MIIATESKIAVTTAVTGPPLENHGDSPKMNAETWQGSKREDPPHFEGDWTPVKMHMQLWCASERFILIHPSDLFPSAGVCVCDTLFVLPRNRVSRAENFPTLHVQEWSCTPKMTSTLTANPHFSWTRDKPTSQSYVAWVSCTYKNDFLASMGWFREQLQEHIWVWLKTGHL